MDYVQKIAALCYRVFLKFCMQQLLKIVQCNYIISRIAKRLFILFIRAWNV